MQFQSLFPVVAAATGVGLASAQTISVPSSGIPSSAVSSIFSKITADLSSYNAVLATASIPASLASDLSAVAATATAAFFQTSDVAFSDYVSQYNEIITGTPEWFAGIPTDVQSYIKSVASADASIVNKDINAAPGGRAEVAFMAGTAVVAAVAVAGAVML